MKSNVTFIIKVFLLGFVYVFLSRFQVNGQNIAITDDNTYAADASAMLDVKSADKGILIPRMNSASRALISSPATGLLVFDTDKNAFYYYGGTKGWINLSAEIISAASAGINDPLFMVKNNANDTVFAVYPESVQIQVGDGVAKGAKGGFAVGGLSSGGKTAFAEYMKISPSTSTDVINPSEARFLWYPAKNAFMAGQVLIANVADVGQNSLAIGYETKAQGDWSQSLGYQTQSVGNYSTAIGKNSVANYDYSFAVGESATADNLYAYAIGRSSTASGSGSYAFGWTAAASGPNSFALGKDAASSAESSVAIGRLSAASGTYSTAIGYNVVANKTSATALGYQTQATGNYSTAMGYQNSTSGAWSTVLGYQSNVSNDYSTAIGYQDTASGKYATAIGFWTKAIGNSSVAMGDRSKALAYGCTALGMVSVAIGSNSTVIGRTDTASGSNALAMGISTYAAGDYSTSMGAVTRANGAYSMAVNGYTIAASGYEMVVGRYNDDYTPVSATGWSTSDRLFVIGMGTSSSVRKNAMTVMKSGRIGLQTVLNPTYALELPYNTDTSIGGIAATNYITLSSKKTKSDVESLSYGLNEILKLKPVSYFQHDSYIENGKMNIENSGVQTIGLNAEDIYEIIPEAVNKPKKDGIAKWGISYGKLVPVLIKAIQEQQEIINAVKLENSKKTEEMQSLKMQMVELYEIKKQVEKLTELLEAKAEE